MLIELWIKDFAIIDELRVGFEPGFNALTGETGAGKSIIIDALGAVLGERVGSDVVRSGAKLARVEATFDVAGVASRPAFQALLADLNVDLEDDSLILGREVLASGRSSARINGRAATAGMLGRCGAFLVDIHGQSDHLTLLRTSEQLEILDRYAVTASDRADVARLVRDVREVRAKIAEIEAGSRERAQRIDLLRFQASEIESAQLRSGEEERLLAERRILGNAERLASSSQSAYAAINGEDEFGPAGGMLVQLQQVQNAIADIAAVDEQMANLTERANEILALVQDLSSEVRGYRDGIEADPARLEWIEDRLETFKGLKRKYGTTVEEVIKHGQEATGQLERLTGGEAGIEGLREREHGLLESIGAVASALSSTRRIAGERLASQVEATIAELNMGRSTFQVEVVQIPDPDGVPYRSGDGAGTERVAVDSTGADKVQFLIATNAGEQLKPLGRVASGGETARLMLALKSTLSLADETPVLVFDEVDVGVGGRSGQVVGEKLWTLAQDHQVVVITHLPQIAAFADAHFQIAKAEHDGRVVSHIEALSPEERIDELAAMLDGLPVTAASRASAVEMVERVERWKTRAGVATVA